MPVSNKLIVFAIIAYFIGNISPATILGRLAGIDIKKEGSGNAGTTNVLRVLGWKAAVVTLVVDILKGYIAVSLGLYHCGTLGAKVCFAAVILGHVFPVLLKFKGGKGVAASLGAAWAINWPSAFAALLLAALGAGVSKKMSVGSIAAAIFYPFLIMYYDNDYMVIGIIMACMLIFTHRKNIVRIINGEEKELRFGSGSAAQPAMEAASPAPAAEATLNVSFFDSLKEKLSSGSKDSKPAKTKAAPPEKKEIKFDATATIETPEVEIEEEPVDYFEGVEIPVLDKEDKKKIAILGAGAFGTALANVYAHNGHQVMLWSRDKELIDTLKEKHVNKKYLPGAVISDKIRYTVNMKTAMNGRDIVIFALPAQQMRYVAEYAGKFAQRHTIIVSVAKGIERGSNKMMTQILRETMPKNPYAVMAGPVHAEELVRNLPNSAVFASRDEEVARLMRQVTMSETFKVYISDDIPGVEVGSALTSIIAIATGISDGLGMGEEVKSTLMTRGIKEISRLGIVMGAKEATFAGLSGIGDIMVTCSSDLSRNRKFGLLIGQGVEPSEALEQAGTVVEGFYTIDAALELAEKRNVPMPFTAKIGKITKGEAPPAESIRKLTTLKKKKGTKKK